MVQANSQTPQVSMTQVVGPWGHGKHRARAGHPSGFVNQLSTRNVNGGLRCHAFDDIIRTGKINGVNRLLPQN